MDRAQLGAYTTKAALNCGLLFGVYLIIKFAFEALAMKSLLAATLYVVMTICVPVMAGFFAAGFAKQLALTDADDLPLVAGFRFVLILFFAGGSLLTVCQFLYYEFINPEFLAGQIAWMKQAMAEIGPMMQAYEGWGGTLAAIEAVSVPSSADMALQSLWSYAFAGMVFGFPIAAIARSIFRKNKQNR